MIDAIIIDDESRNIKILKGLLEEFCPEVRVIGEAMGSQDAIKLIRKLKPDLIFLDIEMPYGNGFDLLDKLMPVNFEIIFITAFDEYTLKAFRYSALDYLLKPVNIEELKQAIKRAESTLEYKNINRRLNNLLSSLQKPRTGLQKIAVTSREGLDFLQLNNIVRCEASGGYTHIYNNEKKKYVSSKSIREYEELLPAENFLRVHNSHIINLNAVKKYHKGRGGVIEMEDGSMIELATRRKEEFLSRFGFK